MALEGQEETLVPSGSPADYNDESIDWADDPWDPTWSIDLGGEG